MIDKYVKLNSDYINAMLHSVHWLERKSPATYYFNKLKSFLKDTENKTIIDIGCAQGIEVNKFNELGLKAVGIDSNSSFIKEAKSRFPELTFYHGDAENTFFESNTFDIVFSINTLFFTNIDKSIPEFIRIVKKNGVIIITLDVEIIDLDKKVLIHSFSLKNLEKLLNKNNTNIIYKKYNERIDDSPFRHKHKYYELILRKNKKNG